MEQESMDEAREEVFARDDFSDGFEENGGEYTGGQSESRGMGGAETQDPTGDEPGVIRVTLDGQPVSLSLREAEQLIGRGKAWKSLKQENERLKKSVSETGIAQEERNREIEEFVSAYPEVTPDDIPMEVWKDVGTAGRWKMRT
jgi:hypothetical protein